jgi:hypothetical protein
MDELTKETGLKIGDLIYKACFGERDTTNIFEVISFMEKKKQYYNVTDYPETFETKLLTSDHNKWWWDYIVKLKHNETFIEEEYVIYSFQSKFTQWSRMHFTPFQKF